MRRRFLLSAVPATALLGRPLAAAAAAATVPKPATIGIMGGEIDGTFMRIATDLTSVLNSDDIRVVPIVGKGSLQNMGDLLHLPGVDLALIASDCLGYAKTTQLYPNELEKIQYICKLYDNDIHVCGRPEIGSLADLQGKAINIDVPGSGTNLSARTIFATLGITPDFRTEEPTIAQDKLMRGEIAANVYSGGKPIRLFATAPANSGLHFVPIPSNEALEKTYLPGGQFTHKDYPTLIPSGQVVETVGVGVVLAVFGWAPGTVRYRNMVTFVDKFFGNFAALLKPPHHPKWHDVNLAAAQPGWTRFQPAVTWLATHVPKAVAVADAADPTMKAQFDQFLTQRGIPQLTSAQRDAALMYFQQQMQLQAR